jgi:hypothetical protein
MATKYRCYLLELDRIASVQFIECVNDATALLEADRILARSPFTCAEIWDRERQVSIISRKSSAASAIRLT